MGIAAGFDFRGVLLLEGDFVRPACGGDLYRVIRGEGDLIMADRDGHCYLLPARSLLWIALDDKPADEKFQRKFRQWIRSEAV